MNWKMRKWKNTSYELSLDYYLAKLISEITDFDVYRIIVWYAQKEKGKFNYFLFQYKGIYYELHNKKLKEIDKKEVFFNNKTYQ